jgi:hypothetical protein
MSVRSSFNELALALAAFIAGFIVTEDPKTGVLEHYNMVGYVAVAMSLLSVWLGSHLVAIDQKEPQNISQPSA